MHFRKENGFFDTDFKRSIVSEIESGTLTVFEVQSSYGILGHSTILKWCRKYGEKSNSIMEKHNESTRKIQVDDEKTLLRNQVMVLEKELKEARWKQATLETLIDVAERHYSIVIKKNFGRKQ